ncbi:MULTISPECIES: HD domain-containing protein [Streptomycetaceae]|uniref:HD domain-containing protein n=1 Tax=Streptantibioticus cattleyicolor (strain ATCC 35852 / DSM 46488 / JCM 4925 / NBRC 14057 / NRRL 8057) TaxID=1003195 RepID=F8JSR5_STREN|nr:MULTISPECIES: hypothetical protein [Streptomycetaceae]AEW97970.1 hypothetical protein SCATT_55990 [Streptantibioticus cattleyicolor NRRL 8057 = DSM 46488]MYS62372.1 hypothetical protein [Streptomyces sp. SID5468]CCB78289.1 conserved protein of unknown function [Streptantibioticus cattleyicolor NRRL 8057 = DSM 46488]
MGALFADGQDRDGDDVRWADRAAPGPAAWRGLLAEPALARLLGRPLVDDALDALDRLVPPEIAVHSLRTFLLADAYARRHGVGYDAPGLLAAAAFHDTGLTGAAAGRGPFPRRSAAVLDRFLVAHAVGEARRRALVRAVSGHMRPWPGRGAGTEARLLHFGAWLDVTGRGGRQVPGERRRLAALAPTPWFPLTFTVRLAACRLHRTAPGPSAAGRRTTA